MARPPKTSTLNVWVNGKLAGQWRVPARSEMELQYEKSWVDSEEGRPLSLSLPFTLDNLPIKGRAVEFYFDNLLPDSAAIRNRLKARFNTETRDAFDLLAAIGRDCVGAVQLLSPGATPDIYKIDGRPLAEAEVEARLAGVVSPDAFRAVEDDDSFRISIAGTQEKTAFLWHKNRWCLPRGATPSTHIFKLPLGRIGHTQIDMSTSVENEWLCSRVLKGFGMSIAQSEIAKFGSQKALVVERFDRRLHQEGNYWLRLVQEDFCQATATPSSKKYEEEGGPGMPEIASILRGSMQRDEDLKSFLKAQILFWMLAAIDGHAKNFSIQLLPHGYYKLTPLYDVLSAWPIIGHGVNKYSWEKVKLAMAVRGKNKHYRIKDIQRRHFNQTASRIGVGDNAEGLISEVLEAAPRVISQVQEEAPKYLPENVLNSVLDGLEQSTTRLASMSA